MGVWTFHEEGIKQKFLKQSKGHLKAFNNTLKNMLGKSQV